MIGEALEYPRRGENWLERVGIGGGLLLLSFVVPLLPQLVVFGHGKRVMSRTIDGDSMPPEFGDWEGLFIDGAKLYGVSLVFALVPTIVMMFVVMVLWFLFAVIVGAAGSAGGEGAVAAFGLLGTFGFLVVMLVTFVLFLVAYYFVPAGMVRFAATDDFGAAFDLSAIRRLSTTGEYFRAWLGAVAVGIGASFVQVLLMITIVGLLAVPFVQFYVQMAVFRMFGRAYDDAMGTGAPGPASDPSPSAEGRYERY